MDNFGIAIKTGGLELKNKTLKADLCLRDLTSFTIVS